jgi:spermidine synthase
VNKPTTQRRTTPLEISRHLRALIYVVFFASGATALVYEITWMRILSLALGSTALASTLILSAFFSGLALGAYWFGRFIDRTGEPLLIYTLLEIGLGGFAILSPLVFNGIDAILYDLHGSSARLGPFFGVIQFGALWLSLLIPTFMMGGTLPVMSKFLIRREETSGGIVGRLYAFNTFGAFVGTLLSAFLLIRVWGISTTIFVAAGLNIGLGLVILAVRHRNPGTIASKDKRVSHEEDTKPGSKALTLSIFGHPRHLPTVMMIIVFLSGLASLAIEVFLIRILTIVFDSSVQSFGIVLAVFIGGFALGSLIFARVAANSSNPFLWIGGLWLASATLLVLFVPLLDRLPMFYYEVISGHGGEWQTTVLFRGAIAMGLLLPLTVLMGGVFPIAVQILGHNLASIGGSVGHLYSWNTLGCILGSTLAGFFILPFLGTWTGLVLFALILGIAGLLLLWHKTAAQRKVRVLSAVAFSVAVILAFVDGPWQPEALVVWWGGQPLHASDILFYEEGRESNVAVVQREESRSLFVGKKLVASDDHEGQRHLGLLAHIPLLLHPEPKDVMVIGLATGITLNATLSHHVRLAECVDINPLMIEAAQYFKKENNDVLNRSEVEVVIADARHYIRTKTGQFDCITTDPIHPADANSNNLYSLEFYRMAADALKENGIMCQWLPTGDLPPLEIKRIIATFSMAFKHVSLWMPNLSEFALIGSNDPIVIDIQKLKTRLQDPATASGVAKHLGEADAGLFLSLFLLGPDALAELTAGLRPNTDDWPILEYEAPKYLLDMANLPELFYEIAPLWAGAFDELWTMVDAEQRSANKEEFQAAYTSDRDRNLENVAMSIGLWCRFLEEHGELNKALVEYKRMFSLFPHTINPSLLDACVGMSIIHEKLGNRRLAQEFYETAIQMAPEETLSRNLAAQAYASRDLYAKAQKEWQSVIEMDPQNREASYRLQWLRSQGLYSDMGAVKEHN